MRSTILVPKLSYSRLAYRTAPRCFLLWVLAQSQTRRTYKSPTYPRRTTTRSRAPCANVFASSFPALSGHLHQRRHHDPSSADADANDDPLSAPSPASSSRECSIPVVYSFEVPSDDVTLLPLANSELVKGSVDELVPLRDFRVRILLMLGPHISTYVLCELAGRPIERPLPMCHR
jgi:hypothetical protein